jgi:hypothetical protein
MRREGARRARDNELIECWVDDFFFFCAKVQFQFANHFVLKLPDRKLMNKRHLFPTGTQEETAVAIKFYAKINLEIGEGHLNATNSSARHAKRH